MKYNLKNVYDKDLPNNLNNFLNYLTTIKGKSPNTIEAYKIDLCLFFRFLKLYKNVVPSDSDFDIIKINDIDNKFVNEITLQDLYAFLSFLENYRQNGSYARARKVATLKSYFNYMYSKQKVLDENPAAELETPKIEKRNPIYLSLDESKKLLNVIKNSNSKYKDRDYCIITFFLNCGLRLSELRNIDIDKIKDDILRVIGKGNKERTVYLNKACLNSLNNYIPIREEQIKKAKGEISIDDSKALFLSNRNKRISKRTIEKMVKKYVYEAGLDYEKFSPHKLRHTAATLMYKYGDVDIRSLQQILGHESVSTTQIYTHVDNEELRKAVKSNPLSEE